MRIGICDDEKNIRRWLEQNARQVCPDAEILEFEDGKSLLSYSGEIDILFLDIQMEGTDGMAAARKLREVGSPFLESRNDHLCHSYGGVCLPGL